MCAREVCTADSARASRVMRQAIARRCAGCGTMLQIVTFRHFTLPTTVGWQSLQSRIFSFFLDEFKRANCPQRASIGWTNRMEWSQIRSLIRRCCSDGAPLVRRGCTLEIDECNFGKSCYSLLDGDFYRDSQFEIVFHSNVIVMPCRVRELVGLCYTTDRCPLVAISSSPRISYRLLPRSGHPYLWGFVLGECNLLNTRQYLANCRAVYLPKNALNSAV